MVSEPVASIGLSTDMAMYAVPQQHDPYMQVSMMRNDDFAIEIPQTYEEAMSMDLLDLEKAQEELLRYVDELAEEFNLS